MPPVFGVERIGIGCAGINACKQETYGSVLEGGAVNTLIVPALVEQGDLTVFVVRRNIGFPARAEIQCEMRICLPGVLHISSNVILPVVLCRNLALLPLRRPSHHHVRHRKSDVGTVEYELTRCK